MTKEQLGELILSSEEGLYRVAKSLLYNDADCADAIQEMIVKAFSNLHTLKNDSYAKTWIVRILMNECYAIMRKEKKLVSFDSIYETAALEARDYSDLYLAISKLPKDMRLAVSLYYAEGFSVKEMAKQQVIYRTKRKMSLRKVVAIALAASFALGGTAFAGVKLYQLQMEKEGKYGLKAGVLKTESSDESEEFTVPEEIPVLSIEPKYLPDGMIPAEMGTWSSQFEQLDEGMLGMEDKQTASADEMKNLHQVGDTFPIKTVAATDTTDWLETESINAKVTDVQIMDNISALNPALADDTMITDYVDANGNLLPNKIEYLKEGDGINDLDNIVRTEEVPQKLVYVTIELTNSGDIALKDILFNGTFNRATQKDGVYTFYDRLRENGDSETNGICFGGTTSFTEEALQMGYVDIRQ